MDKTRILSMNLVMAMFVGLFITLPMNVIAQVPPTEEWVATYDGPAGDDDYGREVITDSAGNIYVTGWSIGAGTNTDIVTFKYDPDGQLLWQHRYDGPGHHRDRGEIICLDTKGNVIVAGHSNGGITYADGIILKYTSDGNPLWIVRYDRAYDNDYFNGVALDDSGNIYVTGQSGGPNHFDSITIKYDSAGNLLWEDLYDGPGNHFDSGRDIALDDSGNVYITGHSNQGIWSNSDCFTIKYDNIGNRLWLRRYNGPDNIDDQGWALELDALGNVYVAGASDSLSTSRDCLTLKYDPFGSLLWEAKYNGAANGWDQLFRVALDGFGNVHVAGRSMESAGNYDYVTITYNPTGTQLWLDTYNGPGNEGDEAYSIVLDPLGNVYTSGVSAGAGLDDDCAIVAYDPFGNQLWVQRYKGVGAGDDIAFALTVDSSGNLLATGKATVSGSDSDLLLIKYPLSIKVPEVATQQLISTVEDLGLSGGTENSLTSKLEKAIDSTENENFNAAVNQLEAFINQVEAQRGNKLTEAQADVLIAAAQWIIGNI